MNRRVSSRLDLRDHSANICRAGVSNQSSDCENFHFSRFTLVMLMNRTLCIAAVGVAIVGTACSSNHPSPEPSPVALAALNAEPFVVGSDTTWVVRGAGYELVGWSQTDLALVRPSLDRAVAMMGRVFPNDTLAPIVARVGRIPVRGENDGKGRGVGEKQGGAEGDAKSGKMAEPFAASVPVPSSATGTVVDLTVPDPKLVEKREKESKGSGGAMMESMTSAKIVAPAVRAWLSAHADRVTGTKASAAEASGRVVDPRVPDWAVDMLTQLGDSVSADRFATALAARPESIVPLVEFLVMRNPSTSNYSARLPGDEYPGDVGGMGGGPPTGGRPGMGGGRGGMGGMGGMRGGRRGPGGRARGGERGFVLTGRFLYSAESAVLGEFLSREGYDAIGELIDAQIAAKPIDEVFARRGLQGLAQADETFRQWVTQRGAVSGARGSGAPGR